MREALRPNLDAAGQAMLDYISNLGELAGPLPPPAPAGGGEINDILAKASEAVAFGAKTPAQGATDYIKDVQEVLSRSS